MPEIDTDSNDHVMDNASYGHTYSSASYEDAPELQQRNTGLNE